MLDRGVEMSNSRVRLYNELKNCNKCEYRTETSPFVFNTNESKRVMLITMAPGFQAVYRPLTSIRFFRLLCLALYGPNRDIKSVVQSIVHQDIYWTHYHKCYFVRTGLYPKDVPDVCREIYLAREIDVLDPELIVIMVAEVSKRLLNQVPEKGKLLEGKFRGRPVISVNFPVRGTEKEYIELRKRLKEYVPIVDSSAVAENILTLSLDTANTIAKHAEFEYKGLLGYWENLVELYSLNEEASDLIDELWYKKIIIPKWAGYSFIALCYSVIEDQLKSALMVEDKSAEITNKQMNELLDRLPLKNKRLYSQIQLLRMIRNSIVHRNGLYDRRFSTENMLDGIEIQVDRIVIHKEGCENVLRIVREFIDELIAWYDQR